MPATTSRMLTGWGRVAPSTARVTGPLNLARLQDLVASAPAGGILARGAGRSRGTIVVLSSAAAIRPRKANPVYGAAKSGLDAFARGLADSLHGSGVRVLLVRPGFVTGRMTAGMRPAPLATTPEAVGAATAAALRGRRAAVWVPYPLAGLAVALKCVPRPVWRRISR